MGDKFAVNNSEPVFAYNVITARITESNMACRLALKCGVDDAVNLDVYRAGRHAFKTQSEERVFISEGDKHYQMRVVPNPSNPDEILCYGTDVTQLMQDEVTGFLNYRGLKNNLETLIRQNKQCSLIQFRINKLRQVRRYKFQADDELAHYIAGRIEDAAVDYKHVTAKKGKSNGKCTLRHDIKHYYEFDSGDREIVAARGEKDTFYIMIPGGSIKDAEEFVRNELLGIVNDEYELSFGNLAAEGIISIVDSRSIEKNNADKVNSLFRLAEIAYILAHENPEYPFVRYDENSKLIKKFNEEEATLDTILKALDPENHKVTLVPYWHGIFDIPYEFPMDGDYRELMCQKKEGEQGEILARISVDNGTDKPDIIPPGVFIDVAEKRGKINDLTIALIKEVYSRCDKIYSGNSERKLKKLHINLSPYQLSSNSLIEVITNLEKEQGFPGRDKITWEVTETLYGDPEKVRTNVEILKKMGYGTALDDFGEGLSTANRVKQLGDNLDDIKVDMNQTKDLASESRLEQKAAKDFIQVAVSRSKVFNTDVVVEGVESEMMIQQARDVGADKFQGWFFHKPWEFR